MNVHQNFQWQHDVQLRCLKSFTKRLPSLDAHYEKYKTLKREGED